VSKVLVLAMLTARGDRLVADSVLLREELHLRPVGAVPVPEALGDLLDLSRTLDRHPLFQAAHDAHQIEMTGMKIEAMAAETMSVEMALCETTGQV